MPTVHQYHKRGETVEALQVHPSVKRGALETFCPSFRFTSDAGIHFPQEGRPEQEQPSIAFFHINGDCFGFLYDWVVKHPDGTFEVVTEAAFARKYLAV